MSPRRSTAAFTLLEVMIAMGVFFIAVFAILELVSQSLRGARLLRADSVDAGSLAAELMLTNKVEEGSASGDFGDLYPGYIWTRQITEAGSNGLYQVDFFVSRDGGGIDNESRMSILIFRPQSTSAGGRPAMSGPPPMRAPTPGGRR